MKRRGLVLVPAVVLAGLLVWLFATRGTMEQLAYLRRNGATGGGKALVDQRAYQTATTLAGLAVSGEEQQFAQQAERLADHEVDQAFAQALRQASLQQRVLVGAAAALAKRVDELKGLVKDDQVRVDALTAAAKTAGMVAAEGDDLDIAKAQLGLDTDELTDAVGDLARETGDRRGEIQQELAAREAAQKKADADARKEPALLAARQHGTLWGRANAWFDQRSRVALLSQARVAAQDEAKALGAQHDGLERKASPGILAQQGNGTERVAAMKRMAAERVVMSILDDRVSADQQLAGVYTQWEAQVWVQHRIVGHMVLESLAWIAFIVLCAGLAAAGGRALLTRLCHSDQRRARTLETLLMLAVEGVALVAVLLVIFGVPEQTPTVLGLAGAGLTVVFQDYILAFFGWFVLMGRNGIRVCDWVEIDGVGGEVTDIGLFRTMLLETGNWTSRGHPTGRQVAFTNSFAIRGRFFNYTTHGQWMWDEIKLNVPATAGVYPLIRRMQIALEAVTTSDTTEAEQQWRSATRDQGLAHFSAQPTVDLRPAASGMDVLVRFMTRANDRFEMRRKVYETVVGLLGSGDTPLADESTDPAT